MQLQRCSDSLQDSRRVGRDVTDWSMQKAVSDQDSLQYVYDQYCSLSHKL